jgi:hypothetical protein
MVRRIAIRVALLIFLGIRLGLWVITTLVQMTLNWLHSAL